MIRLIYQAKSIDNNKNDAKGDPSGTRTRVSGMKTQYPNR